MLAFLFLSVIALGFLGTGLALGTEPRLVLERSGSGTFRVTGSNYFAGYRDFTKTIDGVTEVVAGSAARDWRSDSLQERERRQSQKHLDFYGADRGRIGWDREADQRQIADFMRGTEPRLSLADPPPLWRMGIAWFSAGFGVLVFIGAIQSNFFPKRNTPAARS
ncbi:MAG: hypothetical protein WCF18_18665 [Chthoniobacteraceae bacterium]